MKAIFTAGSPRTGKSVLDDHIVRSKLNLQFTRAASLRFILDYDGTLSHPDWINLDGTKRLAGDILFTYLPGTALYIGYNDRREDWLLGESGADPLMRGEAPSFSSGRQLFVKFSYLFHL